jgi:dipeptidyl aminopeptidase/acylaminoacyl peptidase
VKKPGSITTPTRFLCGDHDWNVLLVNCEQIYQVLKSLARETQLVVFPGAPAATR